MAIQTTEEFKDGGATQYDTSIEKIKDTDLKVRIEGALQTYVTSNPGAGEYTVTNNPTRIVLGASASGGTGSVHIYRETDVDTAAASFQPGSSIRAADLNAIHDMARMGVAEARSQIITADIRAGQVTSTEIKDGTIVNADINASADIANTKIADGLLKAGITVNSDNIVNGSIVNDDVSNSANIDGTKVATASIPTNRIASGTLPTGVQVTSSNIAPGTVVEADIETGALDNRYYTETELDPNASAGQNVLDARYYTETEADARFYNLASAEEIQSGETWVAADNKVATTAAIDARIIDLVDDVGGFVPIANETSFPTANPDVNNGAGTLVSIKEISTARTPSTGTVTIADGAGTGNTVIINGCGSTVLPAGFGVIVETTTTLHTYTFHRLTPKATENTTVAGIASDVTTVAGIASDVTTVANNNANVTTVAGSISNVNNVSGSIASVNNASANITSINNFGDQYQVASSNPSTDGGGNTLAAGDLFFNTTANELKVYDGSAWTSGVTATGNFAVVTGNNFTGDNVYADSAKATFGTGQDLSIYHVADTESRIEDTGSGGLVIKAEPHIKLQQYGTGDNLLVANGGGAIELYHDNSLHFRTEAGGAAVVDGNSSISLRLEGSGGTAGYLTGDSNNVIGLSDNAGHYHVKGTKDGATELFHDNSSKIQTTSGGINITGNVKADAIRLDDNDQISVGTGNDLKLYHNGNFSYIQDDTSNPLIVKCKGIQVKNQADSKVFFGAIDNAQFYAKYDDTTKFETTATGVDVAGDITATGVIHATGNQIKVEGATPKFTLIDNDDNPDYEIQNNGGTLNINDITSGTTRFTVNSDGHVDVAGNLDVGAGLDVTGGITATGSMEALQLNLSGDLDFGTGCDIRRKTGATNAVVNGVTQHVAQNSLHLDGKTHDIFLNCSGKTTFGSSDGATHEVMRITNSRLGASVHGKVDLNYVTANAGGNTSSATKLSTTSGGIDVTGGINLTTNISLLDDGKAKFGTGDDLQIYHDGNKSVIQDSGTGDLQVATNAFRVNNAANTENMITADEDGAVELFHDGTKKFETDSTGVTVSGVANATHFYTTGNIGRDSNDAFIFTDDTRVDLYLNNNNEFRFEADGDFHADGDVIAFSTTTASDERLKENIEIVSDPIEKVEALRGVTFDWKRDGTSSAGVIAQDVMKVLPEAVKEVQGLNDNESHLAVNYHALTSILIESVKELSARVKELEAK